MKIVSPDIEFQFVVKYSKRVLEKSNIVAEIARFEKWIGRDHNDKSVACYRYCKCLKLCEIHIKVCVIRNFALFLIKNLLSCFYPFFTGLYIMVKPLKIVKKKGILTLWNFLQQAQEGVFIFLLRITSRVNSVMSVCLFAQQISAIKKS